MTDVTMGGTTSVVTIEVDAATPGSIAAAARAEAAAERAEAVGDIVDTQMAAIQADPGSTFAQEQAVKIGSEIGSQAPAIIAATPTVEAAAATAATTAVSARLAAEDIITGDDVRAPLVRDESIPYLKVITDAAGNVMGGWRADGTFESLGNNIALRRDWDSDWLKVFTDADDRVLGGWKKDGVFYDLGNFGGAVGGSDVSVWPAVAYGSSGTQGADLADPANERWTKRLELLTGQTIINLGASGATLDEVVARQGGLSFTGTVTGNTIPASGSVTITGLSIQPVRSGDINSVEVIIAGIRGTLGRSGNFTRSTAGAAVTVSDPVDIYSATGKDYWNRIHFIAAGTNNFEAIAAGTQTLDDLCEWYTDAISSLTPAKPRFVVWGLMDAGLSWGQAGTASEHYHEYVKYVEKFLAGRFGSNFVNFRKYLSSTRALAECGITPTTDDLSAIAAGVVPRSLRLSSGSTHLIAAAHQLQANVFYRHMLKKGWI